MLIWASTWRLHGTRGQPGRLTPEERSVAIRAKRRTYTRSITTDVETRSYIGRRIEVLRPGQYDLRYFVKRKRATLIQVPKHLETKTT